MTAGPNVSTAAGVSQERLYPRHWEPALPADQYSFVVARQATLQDLAHMTEYCHFCRGIPGENGSPQFALKLHRHMVQDTKERLEAFRNAAPADPLQQEISLQSLASANRGLIHCWLGDDEDLSGNGGRSLDRAAEGWLLSLTQL